MKISCFSFFIIGVIFTLLGCISDGVSKEYFSIHIVDPDFHSLKEIVYYQSDSDRDTLLFIRLNLENGDLSVLKHQKDFEMRVFCLVDTFSFGKSFNLLYCRFKEKSEVPKKCVMNKSEFEAQYSEKISLRNETSIQVAYSKDTPLIISSGFDDFFHYSMIYDWIKPNTFRRKNGWICIETIIPINGKFKSYIYKKKL